MAAALIGLLAGVAVVLAAAAVVVVVVRRRRRLPADPHERARLLVRRARRVAEHNADGVDHNSNPNEHIVSTSGSGYTGPWG